MRQQGRRPQDKGSEQASGRYKAASTPGNVKILSNGRKHAVFREKAL
jgi:hypothetical protein